MYRHKKNGDGWLFDLAESNSSDGSVELHPAEKLRDEIKSRISKLK